MLFYEATCILLFCHITFDKVSSQHQLAHTSDDEATFHVERCHDSQ